MQRLEKIYPTIQEVCKLLTCNWKDLAHDVVLKLHNDKKFETIEDTKLKGYLYVVARNTYRNSVKADRFVELIYSPADQSQEPRPDPFIIYEKIFEFQKQHEILGIVLELYYEHEGNIASIERDMKKLGFGLTRQTLTKYYKQAQKEFEKWIG